MKQKTILITGATAGIGRAAAFQLAATGAKLVCVARNESKAQELIRELKEATGNPNLGYLLGDLSLPSQVRAVARSFRAENERLDVLFNNAGALFIDRQLTEDGLERTFSINHLSYFVLSVLLTDILQKTPNSRVVSTASGAHGRSGLQYLEDLQTEDWGYGGMRAYSGSKLANIWFTRQFAENTGLQSHCFHPGFVASDFARNNGFLGKLAMTLSRPFQRRVEAGADTGVWLATHEVPSNGGYWFDRKLRKGSRAARDSDAPKRLWTASNEIVGKILGKDWISS